MAHRVSKGCAPWAIISEELMEMIIKPNFPFHSLYPQIKVLSSDFKCNMYRLFLRASLHHHLRENNYSETCQSSQPLLVHICATLTFSLCIHTHSVQIEMCWESCGLWNFIWQGGYYSLLCFTLSHNMMRTNMKDFFSFLLCGSILSCADDFMSLNG